MTNRIPIFAVHNVSETQLTNSALKASEFSGVKNFLNKPWNLLRLLLGTSTLSEPYFFKKIYFYKRFFITF